MSLQSPQHVVGSGESSAGDVAPSVLSSDEASSPAPKTRTHESIWKRSKKILGMGRFEFLQQTSAGKSSDKETDGNDKGAVAGKPGVSKRREQVRRAQKTHRQRTEHYIKALEQEVLRLQKVEEESSKVKIQQKRQEEYIRSLEQQVVSLSTADTTSSVGDPGVGTSDLESESDYFARITMSEPNEDGRATMRAEIPQVVLTAPDPAAYFSPGVDDVEKQQLLAYWGQLLSINSLANCQSAVDFVLYLEFGCSSHTHKVGSDPAHMSGHALTTSGRLIEHAPQHAGSVESWNASCTAIMKLFLLSANLPLDSQEFTPVQAWNEIWKFPEAHLIQQQDLQFLQVELRKITACYGFGGVIDTTSLSSVLRTLFARIRTTRIG